MRRILHHIAEKQRAFSSLPFFAYLRDPDIPPAERLSFVPAGAPFIMAFSDLNKYTLYVGDSQDELQHLINRHSEEDAAHYKMYLKDLKTLGFDRNLSYSEALQFLWADERKCSRQTCYAIAAMIAGSTTVQRIAIVEAVEAAGAAAFEVFADLAAAYRESTGKELIFFGRIHKDLETGHTVGTSDIESRLQSMEMPEEEFVQALANVNRVFEVFSAMMQELLTYVHDEKMRQTFR
jgi:hypothetical protein